MTILKNINVTLAFTFARIVCQFIGTAYMSRVFSKTDLGLLLLFLAISRITELFLVAGDNNVIIRDGEHTDMLGLKQKYYSFRFLLRLILAAILTCILFYLFSGIKGIILVSIFILTLFFLIGRSCFQLCAGILISNNKFVLFGLYDALIIVLSQLLFSRLFIGLGLTGLLTGYVLAYIILAMVYYSLGLVKLQTDNRLEYSRKDSWRFARPELLNIAARSLDTYVLPSIIGVEMMVSYKRGYSVGEVLTNTLGRSLALVLFPTFARMSNYERRKMGLYFCATAIIVGLIFSIIISTYSHEIISFYLGDGWEEAAKVLSVVVYILPARLLAKVVGSLLKASDLLKFLERTQYLLIIVQLMALGCAFIDLAIFIRVLIIGTSATILLQLTYWLRNSNS